MAQLINKMEGGLVTTFEQDDEEIMGFFLSLAGPILQVGCQARPPQRPLLNQLASPRPCPGRIRKSLPVPRTAGRRTATSFPVRGLRFTDHERLTWLTDRRPTFAGKAVAPRSTAKAAAPKAEVIEEEEDEEEEENEQEEDRHGKGAEEEK